MVFESMLFRRARRKWKHRIQTIQRLNRSLFIDAENRGVLGRIHIQSDDIGGFFLELWIVARHVRSSRCGFTRA